MATTVAEWAVRVRRLATALDSLGVPAEGRVGTFMWNTASHLELYLAAPCTGRVLHTLNIRLFPEQQVYIANHAEDDVVFVDRSLLPVFAPLRPQLHTVRHVIVIDDGSDCPVPDDAIDYDALLASAEPFEGRFEINDENSAAAMCYTSGTTGNPKGVGLQPPVDAAALADHADGGRAGPSRRDVLMPVVPMFRVNAWGLPYTGLLAGSSMVFPGPNMTPQGVLFQMERHRVTVTAGVPTIWLGALPLLKDYDLSAVQRILLQRVGRAPVVVGGVPDGGRADPARLGDDRDLAGGPRSRAHGRRTRCWTTTHGRTRGCGRGSRYRWWSCAWSIRSPATSCRATTRRAARSRRPARGSPREYYRDESGATQFTDDGWFRTGDVATVDRYGSIKIVDRTKDLVKSGGEWISSVATGERDHGRIRRWWRRP